MKGFIWQRKMEEIELSLKNKFLLFCSCKNKENMIFLGSKQMNKSLRLYNSRDMDDEFLPATLNWQTISKRIQYQTG